MNPTTIKTKLNGVTNANIANNPVSLHLLSQITSFTGYPVDLIKEYFNNSSKELQSLLELIQSQPKQNWACLIMQTDDAILYWENDDDNFELLVQKDITIEYPNKYKFHILLCMD